MPNSAHRSKSARVCDLHPGVWEYILTELCSVEPVTRSGCFFLGLLAPCCVTRTLLDIPSLFQLRVITRPREEAL